MLLISAQNSATQNRSRVKINKKENFTDCKLPPEMFAIAGNTLEPGHTSISVFFNLFCNGALYIAYDKLMHPILKIWNEAKSYVKTTIQKDNCITARTKNNTRQSIQQIQEIILNDIFVDAYYQPTFQTYEWYPF